MVVTMKTTQQVTGALKTLGIKGARFTRRERRSGYEVRKHGRAVAVSYADYAGEGNGPARFVDMLDALEAQGCRFALLSGERGEAAKAKACETLAVLVY